MLPTLAFDIRFILVSNAKTTTFMFSNLPFQQDLLRALLVGSRSITFHKLFLADAFLMNR